jgi:hypothetical protein
MPAEVAKSQVGRLGAYGGIDVIVCRGWKTCRDFAGEEGGVDCCSRI